MSGSAPSNLPVWSTDANTTLEPTAGKKAAGWVVSEKPPAKWFNWLLNNIYTWILYYGSKNAAGGIVGLGDTNREATWTASGGNATALAVTGNGTGKGVSGTGGATGVGVAGIGGATSGSGVTGTGTAGNAAGVSGQGQGSGVGVSGTGGATSGAAGVSGTGGSTDGVGVKGTGIGTGDGVYGTGPLYGVRGNADTGVVGEGAYQGGYFDGPGSGTSDNDVAIKVLQNICFTGSTPAAGTALHAAQGTMLTPFGFAVACGYYTGGNAGAPTLHDGLNVSISRVNNILVQVTFAAALPNANYAVTSSYEHNGGAGYGALVIDAKTVNGFQIAAYNAAGAAFLNTDAYKTNFAVFCRR